MCRNSRLDSMLASFRVLVCPVFNTRGLLFLVGGVRLLDSSSMAHICIGNQEKRFESDEDDVELCQSLVA